MLCLIAFFNSFFKLHYVSSYKLFVEKFMRYIGEFAVPLTANR